MPKARRAPAPNKVPTRMAPSVATRSVKQVGRNEPCPCGSGKKYKQCHAGEGEEFLQKLADDEARANRPPRPWYLRLLGM